MRGLGATTVALVTCRRRPPLCVDRAARAFYACPSCVCGVPTRESTLAKAKSECRRINDQLHGLAPMDYADVDRPAIRPFGEDLCKAITAVATAGGGTAYHLRGSGRDEETFAMATGTTETYYFTTKLDVGDAGQNPPFSIQSDTPGQPRMNPTTAFLTTM